MVELTHENIGWKWLEKSQISHNLMGIEKTCDFFQEICEARLFVFPCFSNIGNLEEKWEVESGLLALGNPDRTVRKKQCKLLENTGFSVQENTVKSGSFLGWITLQKIMDMQWICLPLWGPRKSWYNKGVEHDLPGEANHKQSLWDNCKMKKKN